jgi:hypothetical protein
MLRKLNVSLEIQTQSCVETNNLSVGGPNFQPATINHFIKAAISGVMPGGLKTSQPLFPKEYTRQFSTEYKDWAPAPFNTLPPPAVELGLIDLGPMPGDSPAPIIRVMHVISGMDRMFNPEFINKSQDLEPSLKAMRSRVRPSYIASNVRFSD